MSNRSDDWREDWSECVVMLPAMVSFGVGAIVLAYQAIHWLNHAVWPTVTVRDGLAWWNGGYFIEVSTGALGFDEIVRWCLDGVVAVVHDADFACGVDIILEYSS